MHKRTQTLDGSRATTNGFGARPEAEQRVVYNRKRNGGEQGERSAPRAVGCLGVHNPDRAGDGLDGDRKRHRPERGPPARMLPARESDKLFGAGRRLRASRGPEPAQDGPIVVAERSGIEPSLKPIEGFGRMRAPVDQIPYAEEPVPARIEPHSAMGPIQGAKTPVHVAADEVAIAQIDVPPWRANGHGHSTGSRNERGRIEVDWGISRFWSGFR